MDNAASAENSLDNDDITVTETLLAGIEAILGKIFVVLQLIAGLLLAILLAVGIG